MAGHCRMCLVCRRKWEGAGVTCGECVVVLRRLAALHGHNGREPAVAGQAERVERYAAVVAAGGRLFEASDPETCQ
jgi:hypothetical protein